MFTSAPFNAAEKVQHDVVECARPLPGHGVAGIVDDGPFVVFHMRAPRAASKPAAPARSASAAMMSVAVGMVAIFAKVFGVRSCGWKPAPA